ncbi:MAG: phenylalanine--tRNA ligase beta subunit-related protein [Bacteroidota bacterium]
MRLPLPDYPGLAVSAVEAAFPARLGDLATPPEASNALRLGAEAPLERSDDVRAAVRDLFRHRGYKPTGRGKPASEYLVKAAEADRLGPINAAVDVCNAVSLHSGLPISVVDLDGTDGDLYVEVGGPDDRYVFNASGQEIALSGLLCLWDATGPCANGVRDSQRTKTHEDTRRALYVIWAPDALTDRLGAATTWLVDLLGHLGAETRAWDVGRRA